MKFTTMLVLLILFAFQGVTAQVRIIGISIPGLHQANQQGDYDKIIKNAVVDSGKAKLENRPPARAFKLFSKCNNCCISPANNNPEFYDFGNDIVQTNPMGAAKIYIWSKPGTVAISSIDKLKGKKLGTRYGMPYGKTFDAANLILSPVDTIEQNIKKLQKGRIDFMIAYTPDAYTAFSNLGIKPFPHNPEQPIATHDDGLVCRGVSKQFIKHFNNAVAK